MFRIVLVQIAMLAAVVLAMPSASAKPVKQAKPAATSAAKSVFPSRLMVYIAKGGKDACGPGCDTWIAVEGNIDVGAGSRFRKFLRRHRKRNLPIYFFSPGGSMEAAYVMGAALRERPAVARVGRTLVRECADSQTSKTCLKAKRSGRELESNLVIGGAVCASACPFAMLGAVTREVGFGAGLAVHSPRLVLNSKGRRLPAAVRAQAIKINLTRSRRQMSSYVRRMGIPAEFASLARSVKHESIHVLSREELYRFRIDTREVIETGWELDAEKSPIIRKFIFAKRDDGPSFRTIGFQIQCGYRNATQLALLRDLEKGVAQRRVTLSLTASNSIVLPKILAIESATFEAWNASLAPDEVRSLFARSNFTVTEKSSSESGKVTVETYDVATDGLEPAWTNFAEACGRPAVTEPSAAADQAAAKGVSTKDVATKNVATKNVAARPSH